MDDWSFALMSCKVVLKSFLADSIIYQRGGASDFAYIIVSGSIQVRQRKSEEYIFLVDLASLYRFCYHNFVLKTGNN